MPGLFDRRKSDRSSESSPSACGPTGRTLSVIRHRGRLYLSENEREVVPPTETSTAPALLFRLKAIAIGLVMVGGLIAGTLGFITVFTATFEAAVKAMPEGSLSSPRVDALRPLIRERSRRRESLAGYDRRIAESEDDPAVQEAWRDLRHLEVEAVARIGTHLDALRLRRPVPVDERP